MMFIQCLHLPTWWKGNGYMVKVIKRDCSYADFDKTKIEQAILKAMKNGSGVIRPEIATQIANELEEKYKNLKEIEIAGIESDVFDKLIDKHQNLTAKAYEGYRRIREFQRESSNTIDQDIEELLSFNSDYWNNENSNKNSKLLTTQRDYMAGILSTDITRRFLLPPDIVQAHDEGMIHFHDADYFAQHSISNCFSGETELVTDLGVKKFNEFYDGDQVQVKDKAGTWRPAIIRKYGKQQMFDVTFKTPRTRKTVTCTANHRWILKDGTVTTNLKVGDILCGTQDTATNYRPISAEEQYWFCYGFILGDGSDTYSDGKFCGIRTRLCGEKNKWLKLFLQNGYQLSQATTSNGDHLIYNKKGYSKRLFLESKGWRLLSLQNKIALFHGYYAADGFKDRYGIATTDINLSCMIEELSALSGYYITSKCTKQRDTNYKKDSLLITFRFFVSQCTNWLWKVVEIKPHFNVCNHPLEAWCVEEPITHSFTLGNGIVTGNCCLINLEDMLQNGTCINKVRIDKPHRLITATTIATQIITAVTSSQYGGATITLAHLAPFVRDSYERYLENYERRGFCYEDGVKYAKEDLKKEISDAVQTFNYQCNSMTTTNGQAPFLSVCMYLGETEEYKEELAMLIEEFLKQRILGLKNEVGVYVTQAFPKLLYVLEEDNIHEDSPYWYLTKLAAECTAKRMVPDYISEKIMLRDKGDCYPCMGCRSFLTPDRFTDRNVGNMANSKNYDPKEHKYYGRFNQGVVTLNLVDIALSSGGDFDTFWKIFEERTELCHKALRIRHERLKGTPSDVAPIIWQDGAFARLKKGEVIDKLLYNGYSTISLGYAGLYECVKYMTGHSHTDMAEGTKFGLKVMHVLNDKCSKWKMEENIDYSLYGSPIESTTYKFAKCLKRRFGVIKGVTDRDYITNSYHVPVFEEINPFTKLELESKFQKLSPGGAISYVECADLTKNTEIVLQVMQFIYNHIMYAELNTKSDFCQECGYDGEIKIIEENGELIWECPNCGNRDKDTMNVTRRTCGYIGTNFWNQGRTEEIKERYVHIDDHEYVEE